MPRTIFLGFVVSLLAIQPGCKQESPYQEPPPPKVTLVKPVIETVPIFLEENGETEAVEQAIVQARVQGIVEEIKFEPATRVDEGATLFVIQQVEYLAQVQSAQATLESAKAQLATAESAVGVATAEIAKADAAIKVASAELGRMRNLLEGKAVSQSEFDAAQADLETATAARQGAVAGKAAREAEQTNAAAQVGIAEAELAQAKLNLEWTEVKAPIGGRIGKALVKRGNLVENGTDLVEIIKGDPIWANFNINERFLLRLDEARGRPEENPIESNKVNVNLKRSGDVGFPFKGFLEFYEPKVDQDTGTMQLRAIFPNKHDSERVLIPGLFVRVQIQIGEIENALLIPERAISRDQVGAFVYVVDGDNKATRKNVSLGIKHQEMIVVTEGIESTDSVVVDGIQRVRPGIVVNPQ